MMRVCEVEIAGTAVEFCDDLVVAEESEALKQKTVEILVAAIGRDTV